MTLMNKIIVVFSVLVASVALTGCIRTEDEIFDLSAAQRIEQAVQTYAKRLPAQGGVWAIELYPTNSYEIDRYEVLPSYEVRSVTDGYDGLGYLVMAQFNEDGTVRVGMSNAFTNMVYEEGNSRFFEGEKYLNYPTKYEEYTSLWEFNKDMGPVLTFSTYNDCLHTFCTPNSSDITLNNDVDQTKLPKDVNSKATPSYRYEAKAGLGIGGDYEFVVTSLEEGATHGMLRGKKARTYNRITRLPEATDFESYIMDVTNFREGLFPTDALNGVVLRVGSRRYRVSNICSTMAAMYPWGGDPVTELEYHSYLITKLNGKYYLRFRSAIGKGNETEQEFVYNPADGLFHGVSNPENRIEGLSGAVFMTEQTQLFTNENLNRNEWVLYTTSPMSASFKNVLTTFEQGFKSRMKGAQLGRISFYGVKDDSNSLYVSISGSFLKTTNDGREIRVNLTPSKYKFTYSVTGNNLVLTSMMPVDKDASEFMSAVPGCSQFLATLGKTFTVTANEGNPYYLNTIRCTASNDAESWFSVKLAKSHDDK